MSKPHPQHPGPGVCGPRPAPSSRRGRPAPCAQLQKGTTTPLRAPAPSSGKGRPCVRVLQTPSMPILLEQPSAVCHSHMPSRQPRSRLAVTTWQLLISPRSHEPQDDRRGCCSLLHHGGSPFCHGSPPATSFHAPTDAAGQAFRRACQRAEGPNQPTPSPGRGCSWPRLLLLPPFTVGRWQG